MPSLYQIITRVRPENLPAYEVRYNGHIMLMPDSFATAMDYVLDEIGDEDIYQELIEELVTYATTGGTLKRSEHAVAKLLAGNGLVNA